MVVAEQIRGGADHVPGHGQTLDGVTRVGEVVQRIRQTVAFRIDCLRFQGRRTFAKVRFGQSASAPGFAVGVDQDETGGVHVLKHRPPSSMSTTMSKSLLAVAFPLAVERARMADSASSMPRGTVRAIRCQTLGRPECFTCSRC